MNSQAKFNLQQSIFTAISFKEIIEWKTLIKMLYDENNIVKMVVKTNNRGEQLFENERKQLEEILKKGMIDYKHKSKPITKSLLATYYHNIDKFLKPFITVKYFYDKEKEIGRVYPEKSLSLCSIRREIRHHLSKDLYYDIDMVCAHPTIANEMFKKKYTNLNSYVENRNLWFDKICNEVKKKGGNLDWKTDEGYDICKELFNRLLYFGSFDTWIKNNNLPKIKIPQFIKDLINELEIIAKEITKENPDIASMIKKNENNKDFYNPNGTITSWFLQDVERQVLEKMYEFLKKKKLITKNNAVLCFDGLQVLKENRSIDDVNKVLKDLESHINKTMSLDIKLKVKPFNNLPFIDILNSIEIPESDDNEDYRSAEDDKEASNILFGELEDKLKFSNNQLFYKNDNIWTSNIKLTTSSLMNHVMSSNIKYVDSKGNARPFAQNFTNAKHITETIINMACENPDDDFSKKIHSSTKSKLCFKDGVLDFKTKQFHLWDSDYLIQNPVYTTVIINRNFYESFLNRDEESIKEVNEKIFDAIFEEQKDKVLHFLSRAFAGHFEDKDWSVFIGNRNCGKGVLDLLMQNSMGNYVASTSSGNFMCERKHDSGDQAKKLSWLLDLQFVRLTTLQEINFDNQNKNIKLNGVMIKKVCSGGDVIEARKNYMDECRFNTDTKLFFMVNDLPPIDPIDTLETCIEFKTGKQFKSQEWINERSQVLNEMVRNGDNANILLELNKYKIGDPDIKSKCADVKWFDAFIHILLDNYKTFAVVIKNDYELEDSDNETLTTKILKNFEITKQNDDRINYKDLKLYYGDMQFNDTYKKFRIELLQLGCEEYKYCGIRGLKGLKLIKTDDKPENGIVD